MAQDSPRRPDFSEGRPRNMRPGIMDPLCAAFGIERRLMPTVGRCLGMAIFRTAPCKFHVKLACGPVRGGAASRALGGCARATPLAPSDSDLRALSLGSPRSHRCIMLLAPRPVKAGAALGRRERSAPPQPRVAASGRFSPGFPGFSEGAPSAKIYLQLARTRRPRVPGLPGHLPAFGRFGSGFH